MGSAPTTIPSVRSLPAPGSDPGGIAATRGLLWCADRSDRRVRAIRPRFGQVEADVACERLCGDLTFRDGRLLVVGDERERLLDVDPSSGAVVDAIPLGDNGRRLVALDSGPAGLWVALRDPGVAQLWHHETLDVLHEVPLPGVPSGLARVNSLLVCAEAGTGLVRALDAADGRVLGTARVDGSPVGMAWDTYSLWYTSGDHVKAVRLDDVLHGARGT
ncbi:YncE family protein [Umezawaea sp. NPDC059074]|uniref:YncE family protein n=1 Tax=Umezawaea sp. NPDC059074 TaxID=3346716 RepID=UPI0036A1153F